LHLNIIYNGIVYVYDQYVAHIRHGVQYI